MRYVNQAAEPCVNAKAAQLTFPMPEALDAAEDLLLSLEAGEPKYKSFLRRGAGGASSVFLCDF